MSSPTHLLPSNVLDALRLGRTVEAIKLLREATGMGLAEAKSLIDGYMSGNAMALPAAATRTLQLPDSVAEQLRRGNKIEAIKMLRKKSGLGLKEAKDLIETFARTTTTTTPSPKRDGLSPGEVPKASASVGWIVAVAIAGLVLYLVLRNVA